MSKRIAAAVLVLMLAASLAAGCAVAPASAPEPTAAPEPVTLTVTGGWPDCRAIETAAREFTEEYPNCTIVYEYLQDYYASLEKRLTGEEQIDLFFTTNIQADSALLPYAADLNSLAPLDLSETFPGLIENFTFRQEEGPARLYAAPLGAEMRGLYINKTLLDSLGIAVPTDQASLLAACETLRQKGYIPFHGNPSDFAQTLLYPWVCNLIAHGEDPAAVYAKVNAREPGISELFREPFAFLYLLVEKDYYDYKKAQTDLGLFLETTDEDYSRDFLNVRKNGDVFEKVDDVGQVAFLPSPISMNRVLEKTREDYHSEIEYLFVPAPVGKDGGYAYLSPAHGMGINKNSANVEWSAKFLNFLLQPEHNKGFAELFNVIPNTKGAFDYIDSLYDVPDDHISELGQVTFGYGFYDAVFKSLVETSKANNPKYMNTAPDGSTSLYPLDYYMGHLEDNLMGKE